MYEGREIIIDEAAVANPKCVIVLHGGGGLPMDIKNSLGLVLEGATIVYPSANVVNKAWRAGGKFGSSFKDVLYLSGLIYHLISNYGINSDEIYLIGQSNGGMMAYRLATILPSEFAGIVAISSSALLAEPFDYKGRVLQIHGLEDENIPIEGNEEYSPLVENIKAIKAGGGAVVTEIIGDGAHSIASLNSHVDLLGEIKQFIGE